MPQREKKKKKAPWKTKKNQSAVYTEVPRVYAAPGGMEELIA